MDMRVSIETVLVPAGPTLLDLMAAARAPEDCTTQALAGAITRAAQCGEPLLLRGLDEREFAMMLSWHFPALALRNGEAPGDDVRFDAVCGLLRAHCGEDCADTRWIACAIAAACLRGGVLWQALGLPRPAALGALIQRHFPGLFSLNGGREEWAAFLARRLAKQQQGRTPMEHAAP